MTRHGYDEVVLLTGFPSFAARKMCEELVRSGERTLVHAVVRAKSASEASDVRGELTLEQRGRVNLIEGDSAAMDFGLSGAELRSITAEVDCIHHMAQVAHAGAERAHAETVNVGGARELLEVAAVCSSLRCAVFHSTARVSGDRTGLVLEGELENGQTFRSVVEETLARGEKMMRAAMRKLPIAVVRPTLVGGDSRTGDVDREGELHHLVQLIVSTPPEASVALPSRPDGSLNVVPVDYYVRATRAIGRDSRARGRTFHVGDPAPLTARRVFELIAAAGGLVPTSPSKPPLRTLGIDRFAKGPRPFLEALAAPVSYSLANTTELLADTDIRCPPFQSYVDGLVVHVQQRLREKRPSDADVDDPLA